MTNISSYEITKISEGIMPESALPFLDNKGGEKYTKYFTSIRNDVLENSKLSLGAKGLYCLICFDVTTSLRQLLLDPNTKAETIKFANELMENDYAHFFGLEECVSKDSYLGLSISIQPTDEYKKVVDIRYKKYEELER